MEPTELNSHIERSILRADALPRDVHRVATLAMQSGNAAVVVSPVFVRTVATMLSGTTRCAAVIAFPLGTSKPTLKAIEATSCIKDGADQIEMVPFLPNLLRRDVDAAKVELLEIVRAARATRRDVIVNVFLDCGAISVANPQTQDESLADACRAVRESGCDGVTALEPTESVIAVIRKHAGELSVKAMSAVIVDRAGVKRMIDAGADQVGVGEAYSE